MYLEGLNEFDIDPVGRNSHVRKSMLAVVADSWSHRKEVASFGELDVLTLVVGIDRGHHNPRRSIARQHAGHRIDHRVAVYLTAVELVPRDEVELRWGRDSPFVVAVGVVEAVEGVDAAEAVEVVLWKGCTCVVVGARMDEVQTTAHLERTRSCALHKDYQRSSRPWDIDKAVAHTVVAWCEEL